MLLLSRGASATASVSAVAACAHTPKSDKFLNFFCPPCFSSSFVFGEKHKSGALARNLLRRDRPIMSATRVEGAAIPRRPAGSSVDPRLAKKPWFLINPSASRWLKYWDGVVGIALIFTAIVTPCEVALLESQFDVLFLVNRSIDAAFVLDILLQFVLMVPQQDGGLLEHATGGLIISPWLIARRYLRGWFAIDLASVVVSAFDIVAVFGDLGAGSSVGKLKLLRVLRALRLIKVARPPSSSIPHPAEMGDTYRDQLRGAHRRSVDTGRVPSLPLARMHLDAAGTPH